MRFVIAPRMRLVCMRKRWKFILRLRRGASSTCGPAAAHRAWHRTPRWRRRATRRQAATSTPAPPAACALFPGIRSPPSHLFGPSSPSVILALCTGRNNTSSSILASFASFPLPPDPALAFDPEPAPAGRESRRMLRHLCRHRGAAWPGCRLPFRSRRDGRLHVVGSGCGRAPRASDASCTVWTRGPFLPELAALGGGASAPFLPPRFKWHAEARGAEAWALFRI